MRKLSFSQYLTTLVNLTVFGISGVALGRPLQIIHTNDLHSHLEHSRDPALGSYAAVKATIDRIHAEAEAQGIETLILDAGDFTEGSQFYLSAHGEPIWRTMNAMGYDAVVIGNHDWLTGPVELDHVLGDVPPTFSFIGANFFYHPDRKNIAQYLHPALETERAGIRIAILGLTTNEFVYRWRADDGLVFDPISEATKRLPALRKNNDLVIALTHLGVDMDRKLVAGTHGLDLVVGGHSHTLLQEPIYMKDRGGAVTPIVQAGENGEFVGDLLVDVEPGKPLQILRYETVPVLSNGPQNREIASLVQTARDGLDHDYGVQWLHEVIGETQVPLEKQTTSQVPTVWSQFAVDAIREGVGADFALDIPDFHGMPQPVGSLTREQLFVLYPRIFDFETRYGWNIWTARVKGEVIKIALWEAIKNGFVFSTSGITYDTHYKKGKPSGIDNIRIWGRQIHWYQSYTIAVPEGIGRGVLDIHLPDHISTLLKALIMVKNHDTGVSIWSALEKKTMAVGVIRNQP